jgi:hypothetical protein
MREIKKILLFFMVSVLSIHCNNIENPSDVKIVSSKAVISVPSSTNSGSITGTMGGCAYNYTPNHSKIQLFEPRPREVSQISSILKYTGLPSNFTIYSASIDNAIATIIEDRRYILYDPKLLSSTDVNSNGYWASMSILAHEIGHHLSGHTITKIGSNHNDELEADKFSGFVLYKLGATLSQAKMAIQLLGNENESPTHPSKTRRLQAIDKGWNEANETRYNSAIPPPPVDIKSFEGGISEFKTENLLNEISYEYLREKNGNGSWVSDKVEGIITEIHEHDYYDVFITKTNINGNREYDGPKKGETISISLLDPWESREKLGRAQLSWLASILVPGRRIQFAYCEEGTAPSRHFAYIKYLPALK